MLSLFNKKPKENFLSTDIHSHLLPGIDDGVKSLEESINILKSLHQKGFDKVITTPHIMSGYYENTPDIINKKLAEVKQEIEITENLNINLEAAAEYYVDEFFYTHLEKGLEVLSFGDNYVLIETPFLNKPNILLDVIFLMQSKGYNPVLAHPERYIYIQEDYKILDEILNTNTLLQVNANSFTGYYSKPAKKLAEYIVDEKLLRFVGSDIHNQNHLNTYKKTINTKYFQKCRQLNLINNSL